MRDVEKFVFFTNYPPLFLYNRKVRGGRGIGEDLGGFSKTKQL